MLCFRVYSYRNKPNQVIPFEEIKNDDEKYNFFFKKFLVYNNLKVKIMKIKYF